MQTGSAQCIQALAIIKRPLDGPCRRKRGLLSWVEAQARTQSSQRVQRSRSMAMAAVPLKKRFSVRNSKTSASTLYAFTASGSSLSPPSEEGEGWGEEGHFASCEMSGGNSEAGSEGRTICSIT